jgi:hypothetical protein
MPFQDKEKQTEEQKRSLKEGFTQLRHSDGLHRDALGLFGPVEP